MSDKKDKKDDVAYGDTNRNPPNIPKPIPPPPEKKK